MLTPRLAVRVGFRVNFRSRVRVRTSLEFRGRGGWGLELRLARVKVRFGIGGLVSGLKLRVDHNCCWGCVYGVDLSENDHETHTQTSVNE